MSRLGPLLAAFCLLLGVPARALEVRQTLWGFDGRAVPNRFNPLSLLIANPGPRPFDGELALEGTRGIASDAPVVQATYLAPQQERWVQFQIFVRDGTEYRLRWGRGAKEQMEIPSPAVAPPARVLLTDSENAFAAPGSLRAFPDDLFPTSVAMTDALDAVALDYAPRWEPARRDAFLDWLRRGGLVLVLHGSGGAYPIFPDALAVLNIDGEKSRVGSGWVLRAPVPRREAGNTLFFDRGFPAPEEKTSPQPYSSNFEGTFFDQLTSLTRPAVPWWLLNTFAFTYLLLVGPMQYRWAKRRDYRLTVAIFLGTVVVFGWLFAIVGRRGFGESQTVHSLSVAHALGGGRCDTMQWISAFATRSDFYTLTHEAPANYYSGAPQADSVQGRIQNGREGRIVLDIPLYSARPFVHRAVMQGDDTGVTVERWVEGGALLQQLAVKPGPGFPREVFTVHLRHRDRVYAMAWNDGRWTTDATKQKSLTEFHGTEKIRPIPGVHPAVDPTRPADEQLRAMLPLLHARASGGTADVRQSIPTREAPPEQAQLWIFARAPESFRLRGEGFARENGCVLYVQDVFRP